MERQNKSPLPPDLEWEAKFDALVSDMDDWVYNGEDEVHVEAPDYDEIKKFIRTLLSSSLLARERELKEKVLNLIMNGGPNWQDVHSLKLIEPLDIKRFIRELLAQERSALRERLKSLKITATNRSIPELNYHGDEQDEKIAIIMQDIYDEHIKPFLLASLHE